MTRTIRLLLALALVLAMASMLVGCAESETVAENEATETTTEEAATDEPMNDDDLRAALEAEYGDAAWYPNIMWIGTDQVLLANVTRVETDLGNEGTDYDTAVEISDAVWAVLDSDVINVRIVSGDGMQLSASGSGSPMSEAMDLPPAPTTVDELTAWIDEVYGDSGEDWYEHLEGFEVSDSEGGWQGTTVIVINSDLEGRDAVTSELGSTMAAAVASSEQTMAESFVLLLGSGEQLMSGDLPVSTLSY